MTQTRLRNIISVFILLAHLAIPALIFLMYIFYGFTKEEMTKLLEIIVPMVAAVSGLAITHIIRTKNATTSQHNEPRISRLFVYASLGFPTLFVVVIAGLVLLKAFNIGLVLFEDLKASLVATETLFGAYTGQLMASLFNVGDEKGKEKTE